MKVLVVGQTPPPITGQAVVVAQILESRFPDILLRHVPMRFSAEVNEIGRFRSRKLVELARVVLSIVWERLRWRPDVLFYPPAGGNTIPILRDIAILILTRWMFRFTVFHFHARGLAAAYDRTPAWLRPLYRLAYFGADLAIRPAQAGGDDAARLRARHAAVIPNGVPDTARPPAAKRAGEPLTILFLSQVSEAKGILTLLEALSLVAAARPGPIVLHVVGPFVSEEFRARLEHRVREFKLQDSVVLSGELSGPTKVAAYAAADIFCFPSAHPTESFGLVAVEAMSFGLPVVAADWGGIRDIVEEGTTGLLFPPRDHLRLADALQRLMADPALRAAMGRRGREKYLAEYTLDRFRDRLAAALRTLAAAGAGQQSRRATRARGFAKQANGASD